MGLPNRTTFLQQHKAEILERYRVCSDGNVYRKAVRRGVGRPCGAPDSLLLPRNEPGRTPCYRVAVGAGRPGQVTVNSLRWLLATGNLPNGYTVHRTPEGLQCGTQSTYWASLPPPPTVVIESPQLHDMAWLAKSTSKQLCDLYAALVLEAESRKLNLQTRTIITEVTV